ncbi:MAG TPA: hypothetical protein ENK67_06715, partial [Flavobacteriia bacterium]|nr:hypothetical protein [Flavobacteriia bacterium]
MQEKVYYVDFYKDDPNPRVVFKNGIMYIRDDNEELIPLRAAFRYLTQKPWNRLPLHSKTKILNPTIAC